MIPRTHRVRGLFLFAVLTSLVLAAPAAGEEDAKTSSAQAAMARIERHVVLVSFRFQRDVDAEERGAVPPNPRGREEQHRRWHKSWVVSGFVVRDRRTVLISDPFFSRGAIESITVRTPRGFQTVGRLDAYLRDVEGAVVRTGEDLPVEPLRFSKPTDTTPRFVGSVAEGSDGPEVWLEDLPYMKRRPVGSAGGYGFGSPVAPHYGLKTSDGDGGRAVDLVMDAEARPLGFRFGARLDAGGGWRGPAVLASPEVPLDDLEAMAEREAVRAPLYRLTVRFRTAARHDRDAYAYGRSNTDEEEWWGIALAPDLLVVPTQLEEAQVRRIVSIQVEDADGDEETKAAYAGRLEGHHAFLVRILEGPALEPLPEAVQPPPATGEAILVHRVARRGGERRDSIRIDRVTGWGRGYGDRLFLTTERAVSPGAVLRDAHGRAVGFAAGLHPEDRERQLDDARRSTPWNRRQATFPLVAVLFHELGPPASLGARAITRVMPQEEVAARRLPWLGVEYAGLDEGIAELLEVSGPTRDGGRGLILTVIYPGSPAAKAGLDAGDILLSIRRTSAPGGPPVDLRVAQGGTPYYPGMYYPGGGRAPWRPRTTALVSLLQAWGMGATYELEWWRDEATERGTFTVEAAPADFASAARQFDEAAGLEVRDLTYEVRRVLRLDSDAPGVVVARIEPGSPAAQARIRPNELVFELDGRAVSDAETFRAMLEAAREAGRAQVRLGVLRLGKSRIVDLRVRSGDAADIEEEAEVDAE